MFERMTEEARWVVRRGQEEAHALGATAIEAEHLLVAVAERSGAPAQELLGQAGLTPDRLRGLVVEERARSLRSVGVEPVAPVPSSGELRLATSAKNVLRRAVGHARRGATRGIDLSRLLRGILEQEVGTVPRVLALAGVDRPALIAALADEAA